jgi:hypothetical protein
VFPAPGYDPWPVEGAIVTDPDTAAVDAFGRNRVSDPTTLFAYQHQYDAGEQLWFYNVASAGTYTHLPNEAAVLLSAGAGPGIVEKQTKQYYRYQPGKSQLIKVTGVIDVSAPQAGDVKEMGYYDSLSGIFVRRNGLDLEIVRREQTTGVVIDHPVLQANWNVDPFDGTGPSGITLDTSKSQILVIDLEWLGVGRVRVGWNIDGKTYWAHFFNNANNLATVYMQTANLPIRYYVSSSVGPSEMKAICAAIESEGGFEIEQGTPFCVDNGVTVITCPIAIPTHVISIRPKATFNGLTNRGRILPVTFETYGEANSAHWGLLYDTNVVGGAWLSADPNSIVEYNVTPASYSGGQAVECGYIPVSGTGNKARAGQRGGSQDLFLYLPLVVDTAGANPINLTIYAEGISGPADVAAAIGWLEFK